MTEITVIRDVETIVAYDPAGDRQVYRHGGDVAFDETGLLCVGTRFEGQATTELSGKSRMVMPGLIDIHCHSHDEPLAKGIFEDAGTAALWGQAMYEFSGVIDGGEDARAACLTVMLGDLMRSGATTVLDIAGAHDIWLDIAAQSGVRGSLAPGFRQANWVVHASPRLDFEWDDKAGRDAFARALGVVERARAHPSGRLDGVISPSQVVTCRPDLLVAVSAFMFTASARRWPRAAPSQLTLLSQEHLPSIRLWMGNKLHLRQGPCCRVHSARPSTRPNGCSARRVGRCGRRTRSARAAWSFQSFQSAGRSRSAVSCCCSGGAIEVAAHRSRRILRLYELLVVH